MMSGSTARVMSPGRMNATPPTRTSSTIESSLRTFCRSQSGSGGLRTVIATAPAASVSPARRSTQGIRAAAAAARRRWSGSWRGTGMPSQTSTGDSARRIAGAPPM